MTYEVVYSPSAAQHLADLYSWITEKSGYAMRAEAFVSEIMDFCEDLPQYPLRGVSRDDIRPGLRTIGFRRRVIVAFAVLPSRIEIHGIFYGGRDHEVLFREEK